MEGIGKLFNAIIDGMMTEYTIHGHTFSWWQVFVFGIVASIIATIIGGVLSE